MTDIWVPGFDEIVALFENYRHHQLNINRLAEKLAACAPKETAAYTADVIRVAQEIPQLQRLVEREEEYREQITAECRHLENGDLLYSMLDLLDEYYQREIIRRYYIHARTMAEVANHIPFHIRRCWQIRSDALRIIAQHYTPVHNDS